MKKFIKNITKFLIKEEEGVIAVIFAVMLIPILALSGATIDYTQASNIRNQMQQAADAAALAAGRASAKTKDIKYLEKIAKDIFISNLNNDKLIAISNLTSRFADDGVYVVEVKGNVSTNFLHLIGVKELPIFAKTEVTLAASGNLEVVMVLDNTWSMDDPDDEGNIKLASLKSAANNLVNILLPDGDNDRVKIGVVPFGKYVNIGVDNAYGVKGEEISNPEYKKPTKWYGCVGSRGKENSNLDVKDSNMKVPFLLMEEDKRYGGAYWCKVRPLTPLTTSKSTIKDSISAMRAWNYTYIAPGLLWGWSLLSKAEPYTQAASYNDKSTVKVLILMSDGRNSRAPEYPFHTADATKNNQILALANKKTSKVCENIKKKNIIVYTIAFDINVKETKKMIKKCAGSKDKYYNAKDGNDLINAFNEIANLISINDNVRIIR